MRLVVRRLVPRRPARLEHGLGERLAADGAERIAERVHHAARKRPEDAAGAVVAALVRPDPPLGPAQAEEALPLRRLCDGVEAGPIDVRSERDVGRVEILAPLRQGVPVVLARFLVLVVEPREAVSELVHRDQERGRVLRGEGRSGQRPAAPPDAVQRGPAAAVALRVHHDEHDVHVARPLDEPLQRGGIAEAQEAVSLERGLQGRVRIVDLRAPLAAGVLGLHEERADVEPLLAPGERAFVEEPLRVAVHVAPVLPGAREMPALVAVADEQHVHVGLGRSGLQPGADRRRVGFPVRRAEQERQREDRQERRAPADRHAPSPVCRPVYGAASRSAGRVATLRPMPVWGLAALCLLTLAACGGSGRVPAEPEPEPHPLDHLAQVVVSIRDEPYLVWLAETPSEQARGLQGLTEEQIAPLPDGTERGMLFVFALDVEPEFWMRDTLVPLDLAFVRSDGSIAETHALEPLDETRVGPAEPVRHALEVRGGVFDARGIRPGRPRGPLGARRLRAGPSGPALACAPATAAGVAGRCHKSSSSRILRHRPGRLELAPGGQVRARATVDEDVGRPCRGGRSETNRGRT